MTTKQMFEIASDIIRNLPEVLGGVSYERALEFAEPDNLKRAFLKQVSTFKRDMREKGWELLEDVPDAKLYEPDKFELVEFLKKTEKYIKEEELVSRARGFNANFGQCQTEFFLENQEKIPVAWRDYYIVFPATIWRDRHGYRHVPYLHFFDGEWRLHYSWLVDVFDSYARLLRLCE